MEDHSIWSHHFMANRQWKEETVADFIFLAWKIRMHLKRQQLELDMALQTGSK